MKYPVKTSKVDGGYFMMMDISDASSFIGERYKTMKKYEEDSIVQR
jgi:hypothetical protein